MPARRKARKRALDVLYEADLRGLDPLAVLSTRRAAADPPVPPYAGSLVEGVAAHLGEIDVLLERYAEGWSLARMPVVDRNVLRLGAYELLWCRSEIPLAVAISEAVELARSLSGDDAPRFVNGLLAGLAETEPHAGAEAGAGRDAPASQPSDAELDGAAGVGREDAPGDELLGERARGGVVDDGE